MKLLCTHVCLVVVLISGAASPAVAQSELAVEVSADDLAQRRPWELTHFTVFWDNDGAYLNPIGDSDRHYTNGVKIDFAFDPHLSAETAEWLAPSARWTDPKFAVGFVIAQQIFTGTDIEEANPPAGDRPWAGHLYGGVYFQRADAVKHDHFELDIGLIGPESQAESIQTWIHRVIPDQVTPAGWDNQLSHEATVNFRYQRSWKLERADVGSGLQLDAIPRAGFNLGNVLVQADTDVTVRLGMNLPDDFGPPRMLGSRDATGGWSADTDWGVYGFVRFGVRAVAHNIFLAGNTFVDSASADTEPLVGEIGFGVLAHYRDFEFGWSATLLTDEFEGQTSSDTYGSLVLSWVKRY